MNWKYAKVLVAGGAGMIGSHVARRLVKEGAFVTVVDNLSSGSLANIKDIEKDIVFHKWDLRNIRNASEAVFCKDVVFIFCANMGGIGYISSVKADVAIDNILMNVNLLVAAKEHDVGHIYLSSSACIYPCYLQTTEETVGLKESMDFPADPNEIYGMEKLFSERVAMACVEDYGMNIKIGRHHNVYGVAATAFDSKKGKAPCHLIIKAIKHPEEPFTIWGDGKQVRSFLHVDDCVEMVLRLMGTDYRKPINIGTEQGVSIDYLASLAIKASGKDIKPLHDLSKPQGVRGRNSDNTLFRQIVGYDPKISLEEGIPKVYDWALQNYSVLEGI